MHIDFSANAWNETDIVHAWGMRFNENGRFVQKEDHIENREDPACTYGFENIALMSREKYGPGAKITVECSFTENGAPLITLSEDLFPDGNGDFRYGSYYELVLYKNGINLWRHYRDNGKAAWYLAMSAEFPVPDSVHHRIAVGIRPNYLDLYADGRKFSVRIFDMAPAYHLGLTSCEGVNSFYSMDIEG